MSFNVICQDRDHFARVYCITADEALRQASGALSQGCETLRVVSTDGSIVSIEHLEALAKAERFEAAMYRPDERIGDRRMSEMG